MKKKNEIQKDDLFIHNKIFNYSVIWWKRSRYIYVKDIIYQEEIKPDKNDTPYPVEVENASALLINEKSEENIMNISFLENLVNEQAISLVKKDSDKAKVFLSMIS